MNRLLQRSATRNLLCLFWGAAIVAGLHELTAYSNTAAEIQPQSAKWPRDTAVPRAGDRPTMVLALHPRCVCSGATIEELARLLAQAPTPLSVEILLYQPDTAADSWAQTSLAIRARSLPGVTLRADRKGRESERFGIPVSGHTAVYAPDGRLLFSGGITRARGHAGDNAGRAAVISLLSNRQPVMSRTPVFGCSIRDES